MGKKNIWDKSGKKIGMDQRPNMGPKWAPNGLYGPTNVS